MSDVTENRREGLVARLRGFALMLVARMARRRETLAVAAAVLTGLVGFASLPLAAAALAYALVVAWALVWRSGDAAFAGVGDTSFRQGAGGAYRLGRQKMLVALVDNLPDATLVLDGDGHVIALNDFARDLFGVAETGRHLSQTTRAPDLLEAVEVARDTATTQSCRLEFKVPVERSLTGWVTPLSSDQQEADAPAVLIVLRDLSEQDLLMRMRADFVANASHELRTPLASLKGFVETLQHAAKDDPAARDKFLGIMQQQADRMARLIDDLLSLSRIEMHAHVMPRSQVELSGLIAHVVQTLQPIAEEKAVTLNLSCGTEGVVTGDRDELIQVFQNLIENAIKYGRSGGRVDVTCAISGGSDASRGRYMITVSDDGPGIAAEHLPRLTERFYRVNAAESRHVGGTGLGLAIVKHVVNRHRGDLLIESRVGRGSTFRVVLPLVSRK